MAQAKSLHKYRFLHSFETQVSMPESTPHPPHPSATVHITAAIDFACPWCAVSIATVRSPSPRFCLPLTAAPQLHAHLDALAKPSGIELACVDDASHPKNHDWHTQNWHTQKSRNQN